MDNTQTEEYLDLADNKEQGQDFETGLEGLEMPNFEMNFNDMSHLTSL